MRKRMRKIEIDEEIYQALQKRAKPFEDTPNDVLRKLLGLNVVSPKGPKEEAIERVEDYEQPIKEMMKTLDIKSVPKTRITRVRGATPQKEYRLPILEALLKKGGKATPTQVFEIIEQKMRNKFNELDLQVLGSGYRVRWKIMVAAQKHIMVQDGLLRSDSKRGIWEITEKGKKFLEENK